MVPRTTTKRAQERKPPILVTWFLLFLITLQHAYIAGVRREPACQRKRRATPTSLLLLRLVSSFHSDHRPEDLQEPEADEEERAAGQGELREGARLALGLVALLAEEGGLVLFDGPARRPAARHALLRRGQRAERPEQRRA